MYRHDKAVTAHGLPPSGTGWRLSGILTGSMACSSKSDLHALIVDLGHCRLACTRRLFAAFRVMSSPCSGSTVAQRHICADNPPDTNVRTQNRSLAVPDSTWKGVLLPASQEGAACCCPWSGYAGTVQGVSPTRHLCKRRLELRTNLDSSHYCTAPLALCRRSWLSRGWRGRPGQPGQSLCDAMMRHGTAAKSIVSTWRVGYIAWY